MADDARPPHQLASLVFLVGFALLLAVTWYTEWLVMQGYPPLRITSLELGVAGVLGIALGVVARRWMWKQYEEALRRGIQPPKEPPRPTLRDWIVGAVYGLMVIPLSMGTQSLAITRMPLVVVVIAALGGEAWRLALVRRAPRPTALVALALAAAGMVVVALGPDARSATVVILLVGVAPLVRAIGRIAWRQLGSAPKNQVISIGLVVGAIALQIAGIERGEVFGDAPLGSTLALAAPIVLLVAMMALMIIGHRAHPGLVARGSAGSIVATLLLAQLACDQSVAPATWVAALLVTASVLVQPTGVGEERKP